MYAILFISCFGIASIGMALLQRKPEEHAGAILGGSAAIAAAFVAVVYLWRKNAKEKARIRAIKKRQEMEQYEKAMREQEKQEILDELRPVMGAYLPVLLRKKSFLVTQDDYGNYSFDSWWKEIEQFMASTMPYKMPEIWEKIKADPDYWRTSYRCAISELVIEHEEQVLHGEEGATTDVDSLTPNEYEHHCASILKCYGWSAKATKASGDQGADVVADYKGVKAVLQCKKYSQPVGNDAVQQVHASKAIYGATVAAVVTNHTYTPAARQLAAATKVHLLHHDDLPAFSERLGLQ